MEKNVSARLKNKRMSSVDWVSNNPVLLDGEIGYETDTGKFKFGNGVSTWNILPYSKAGDADTLDGYQASDLLNYNNLSNKPTSLPANGGNADTLDSQHGNYYKNTAILNEPNEKNGLTVTNKSLFDVTRANKTAFIPAKNIIVEQSTDAGANWSIVDLSDTVKQNIFSETRASNLQIPLLNGVKSCNSLLRVTFTAMNYNVPDGTLESDKYNYWNSNYVQSTERYCSLNQCYLWLSSNSDAINVKIEKATGNNSTSWQTAYTSSNRFTGWAGMGYISFPESTFGGGTGQSSNFWNYRITFRTCDITGGFDDSKLATNYTTSAQTIQDIRFYGSNLWSKANSFMEKDHMYTWDKDKNVNFPAELKESGQRVYSPNNKPTLAVLPDDTTHRTVTDSEKSTWNNKSDFSGNYNDLSNKPIIPSIATVSKAGIVKPDGSTITVAADGTISGIGQIVYGSITPSSEFQRFGVIWIDTSNSTAALLKYWNGTAWTYPGAVWK